MDKRVQIELSESEQIICLCPEGVALHENDLCVVQAERVLECGRVLRIEECLNPPQDKESLPTVLRQATLQDHAKADENALRQKMAMKTCVSKAEKLKLDMQLVQVRYSFDRELLTVLFTADERVDFRELIKDLAAELRTRIEMRQIGVRDQAALVGGLATCGRQLCCCAWLRKFESINVRMAKAQRLALNPGAISGMCGRLKCCLRYEYEQYQSESRDLPRDGAKVETPDGTGRVTDVDIMGRRVKVRLEDQRVRTFDADDVLRVRFERGKCSKRGRDENSSVERAES